MCVPMDLFCECYNIAIQQSQYMHFTDLTNFRSDHESTLNRTALTISLYSSSPNQRTNQL